MFENADYFGLMSVWEKKYDSWGLFSSKKIPENPFSGQLPIENVITFLQDGHRGGGESQKIYFIPIFILFNLILLTNFLRGRSPSPV